MFRNSFMDSYCIDIRGENFIGVEITKCQYLTKTSLSVESVSAAKKHHSYQVDEQVTTSRIEQ